MANQSGASAEALPLPKGGGSTRGLGDSFTPDLNRGTGSYAVEINVPKGHRNLMPRLALSYNTAAGDGPFGYGWAMPLPRIQIDTDRGAADYANPLYVMDGETLVDMGAGLFRPRVENAFQRIRRAGEQWEITDKSGTVTTLGGTEDSRVTGRIGDTTHTFEWLVSSVRDTSGNEVRYKYERDDTTLYPSLVEWAAFEVRFAYEPRPDPSVSRRAGFAIGQRRRCRSIEVRRPDHAQPLIRRYQLDYADGSPSLLRAVTMRGFKRQADGTVSEVDAPPLAFTYEPFAPERRRFLSPFAGLADRPGALGEDGREIVDLNGDGLPDIVQIGGSGRPRVWRNAGGGRFMPPQTIADFPQPLLIDETTLLFDADGRGTADVVTFESRLARYYPNTGAGAFDRPRFFGGAVPLSFSPSDPDAAFADLNGDGRVDLVRTTAAGLMTWENNGEDGFALPRVTPKTSDRNALPDVRLSEPGVFVTDMTGDGLPDIVHVANGLVEYWPSLGGGRYDTRQTLEHPPQFGRDFNPRRVHLADVDGTGTSDNLYAGADRVTVWRNLGGIRCSDPIVIAGTPETPFESVRLVDLLGTGNAGVLWSEVRSLESPGYRFLALADVKPFVLTQVEDGPAKVIHIGYGSSTTHAARDTNAGQPWRTQLPMPVPVVGSIRQRDLVTGIEDATTIEYHDGRWDPDARRFRGFGRVTVRRTGDAETQPVVEEYRYLVGAPGEPALDDGALAAPVVDRARRGQVFLTTYFSGDEHSPAIRTETTTWQIAVSDTGADGTPVLFPQVTATAIRNFEGGLHPRVVTSEYAYDGLGNVVRERRRGDAPDGDDAGAPVAPLVAITETEYAANPANYVMERVARVVRRDGSGAVLGEVRHYYDGPTLAGLPLGQVGAGLMRRQEEIVISRADAAALYGPHEPDWTALGYHDTTRIDGADAIAVDHTRYEYSTHGMVNRRIDPLGGETAFEYDADGLLVVRLTNAAGHVRTATYDPAWQLLESHTSASGAATRYDFDGLGRLVSVVQPGDTAALPTIRYAHDHVSVPSSVTTLRRKAAGGADTYQQMAYFDGLGREIQQRTRLEGDNVRVSGIVRLNRRGDPVFKGQPQLGSGLAYEDPDALPHTPGSSYKYDGIGRLVSAVNAENHEAKVAYTPWTSTISDVIDTDPSHPHANTPRIQHFDPFGRLADVTLVDEQGVEHRAAYTYDLLGRLIASTDLDGRPAIRSVSYDGRGLRLRIDHVATGTRTAVYDARNRLVSYWDPRNQIVSRTYDVIGRLLTESVDGVVQETYHYDVAPGESGRLGRVDDNAGTVTFTYDAAGRVVSKSREVLGQTFDVGYAYDPTGYQSQITYPDGTVVDFARHGDGRTKAVSGFVDALEYDGTGRLATVRHANGVEEQLTFTPAGHLETMRIAGGAVVLFDGRLTHDAAGRLTAFEETSQVNPVAEIYERDALGRLTHFSRSEGIATSDWHYRTDADGNLITSGEMATTGFDYDFTQTGALRSRTLANGTTESMAFDAAGHLSAMGAAAFEFDARGRLLRATAADGTVAEMIYDYRGARVAKRTIGAAGPRTTRYVDEIFEEDAGAGTGYVFAAGRLVGRLRGAGRRHLHVDHRGSVVLVTRTDGGIDGRGWFGPYGSSDTLADVDGSRQMGGLIFDREVGLYYCNQRYYSPRLGRFLSPDPRFLAQPERELTLPEAHNLYVYAGGDPVDYVDPTGEGFWSTLGKILAGVVVVLAVAAAIVVIAWLLGTAGRAVLGLAVVGAVIGGIADGWEGAAMGAMMGATIGINFAIGGPIGIINVLGIFPGIRKQEWYHSLAGWGSWFMPASWPGHIIGLGVFLGNGIAHVFGSDKQIESMKFDWKHGQIMTAGGEYGGSPFPWAGTSGPSHSLGGFAFWSNDTWAEGGKTWKGIEDTVDPGRGYAHETGHMLSNALFGFWQGVVNAIENVTTDSHDDRFFEKIAQSNVPESDRDPGDQVVPIWT
jgi:RHS repeat-associated protein